MCDIVDNSHRYRSSVQQAARDVILDGASVFFPDDETRHFHLMQMIDSIVVGLLLLVFGHFWVFRDVVIV